MALQLRIPEEADFYSRSNLEVPISLEDIQEPPVAILRVSICVSVYLV